METSISFGGLRYGLGLEGLGKYTYSPYKPDNEPVIPILPPDLPTSK